MSPDRSSGFDEPVTTARPSLDRLLASAPSTFQLSVVEGPDRGKVCIIDGTQPGRTLVGQSPVCEFRLTDPLVSRRHIAVDLRGPSLELTDLGSSNGTRVNGVNVGACQLQGGEEVWLGNTRLEVLRKGAAARVTPSKSTAFGRMVGASPALTRLYPLCERLAQLTIPLVIEGETGTGKEILAESLHELSPRSSKPFVVLDCTAVQATLMESELFGHEKGAFTGATSARKGLFEQAHGGTLFIDEIGDLDLALQPKLLRAIERSEIRSVGGTRSLSVDVRIIAATRRDLDREVQEGRFRDDLFHRLAVARVELPPLRARTGDVSVLARHFAAHFGADPSSLPPGLLARWEAERWTGNVRQLRNAVSRQLALGDLLGAPAETTPSVGSADDEALEDWRASAASLLTLDLPFPQARDRALTEFERRYVERALARHDGNVARAAQSSGIARRYFQMLKSRSR